MLIHTSLFLLQHDSLCIYKYHIYTISRKRADAKVILHCSDIARIANQGVINLNDILHTFQLASVAGM